MSDGVTPLVMGVVNVTPDSFSDGGATLATAAAIARGRRLRADGADLLDVGGEATNPRATAVDAEVELARVLPVIAALAADGARVSVDTTKAAVARAAIAAGATVVNDVAGGAFDPAIVDVVAASPGVTYVLGHLRGRTLAEVFAREDAPPRFDDVVAELATRLATLPAGVRARTWIDPGLGFGKGDADTNFELIRRAGELRDRLGAPVVIGASRKRFLRRALPAGEPTTADLDVATAVASLAAARAGAYVLRVHNVALLRIALAVYTRSS